MFDQTFVDAPQSSKKPVTVLLSLLMQLSAICILLFIPLVYTATLPGAVLKSFLVAPPPPTVVIPVQQAQAVRTARVFNRRELTTPIAVPEQVAPINDIAAVPDLGASVAYSQGDGTAGSILLGAGSTAPAPPPLAPPVSKPKPLSGPVKIGTGVAAANLITKVTPPYPSIAKAAGVQGIVEFRATISKEGNIENLQLVRGHPLLVKAATEAVLQWKYRPTLLNGQPVEVLTDIVVNFTLAQ